MAPRGRNCVLCLVWKPFSKPRSGRNNNSSGRRAKFTQPNENIHLHCCCIAFWERCTRSYPHLQSCKYLCLFTRWGRGCRQPKSSSGSGKGSLHPTQGAALKCQMSEAPALYNIVALVLVQGRLRRSGAQTLSNAGGFALRVQEKFPIYPSPLSNHPGT